MCLRVLIWFVVDAVVCGCWSVLPLLLCVFVVVLCVCCYLCLLMLLLLVVVVECVLLSL